MGREGHGAAWLVVTSLVSQCSGPDLGKVLEDLTVMEDNELPFYQRGEPF